jgi:hypothetical protein
MVMDIDRALERALAAVDPGPAFAGRVVAAIKAGAGAPEGEAPAAGRSGRHTIWRAMLPLAATLALAGAGLQWRAGQAARLEEAKGRAAHAQLVQALRLTGAKLNLVHRAIERSQE